MFIELDGVASWYLLVCPSCTRHADGTTLIISLSTFGVQVLMQCSTRGHGDKLWRFVVPACPPCWVLFGCIALRGIRLPALLLPDAWAGPFFLSTFVDSPGWSPG